MKCVGVSEDHARDLADLLVAADYRGIYTHGLLRLDMYVADVTSKCTSTVGDPSILKETVATALVDGQNLLGPVVGKFCMNLAMRKAKEAGIGLVTAKHSNHFGIAGYYSNMATKQGMMGLAFTNTSPKLVPTRAKEIVLGTNPISCSAPGNHGDTFELDMATTAIANGKVLIADRNNKLLPEGVAVDIDGKGVTDPKQVNGLYPLGGAESTSGFKGYGLAMMVDVLCGILSGSKYGHTAKKWRDNTTLADVGHCFIAINLECFADGFTDRMSDLMDYCRNLEPVEAGREVLVPGDAEKKHMAKCDEQGGVLYEPAQIQRVVEAGREVLVPGDSEKNHMAKCDEQGGVLYESLQIQRAKKLAEDLKVEPLNVTNVQ